MRLTPDQTEAIRRKLLASILAFRRGWTIDDVMAVIEEIVEQDPPAR